MRYIFHEYRSFSRDVITFLRLKLKISSLGKRTGLKLGEVSYFLSSIASQFFSFFHWIMDSFRFIFLLRDSENDLLLFLSHSGLPVLTSAALPERKLKKENYCILPMTLFCPSSSRLPRKKRTLTAFRPLVRAQTCVTAVIFHIR